MSPSEVERTKVLFVKPFNKRAASLPPLPYLSCKGGLLPSRLRRCRSLPVFLFRSVAPSAQKSYDMGPSWFSSGPDRRGGFRTPVARGLCLRGLHLVPRPLRARNLSRIFSLLCFRSKIRRRENFPSVGRAVYPGRDPRTCGVRGWGSRV